MLLSVTINVFDFQMDLQMRLPLANWVSFGSDQTRHCFFFGTGSKLVYLKSGSPSLL